MPEGFDPGPVRGRGRPLLVIRPGSLAFMRRIFAALAVAAVSLVGAAAAAAPADAGTVASNGLTISAPDQPVRDGCNHYPIHYTVTGDYPYGWWLDVQIQKPGSVGSFDFKTDSNGPSGDLDAFLCLGLDQPGTWTVNAHLSSITGPDINVSTTFRWGQVVPVKAASAVTVGARPTTVKTGGYVTFSGRATYRRGGTWRPISRALVTIQYQLRGAATWRTFANVRTGAAGAYSARLKFPFKTSSRFRAKLNEGSVYVRSYSKTVYVTRVR